MSTLDAQRQWPGDLDAVFEKIAVRRPDVEAVYLIGSRMWGAAGASSDYDLYVIVKGDAATRNTHFRLPPGLEVDAVVIGAAPFQQRLNQGKLKELSCVWAPAACRLLERHAFLPSSGGGGDGGRGSGVDRAALAASLLEGYEKDWSRARKLIEGGRLVEGKKVLAHCVRAHQLAVQIVQRGRIDDYMSASATIEQLRGIYAKDWQAYAAELEDPLAGMRDIVSGSTTATTFSSLDDAHGGASAAVRSLSVTKGSPDKHAEYWFGTAVSPSRITARQISEDPDEQAVAEVVATLAAATAAAAAAVLATKGDQAGEARAEGAAAAAAAAVRTELQAALEAALERGLPVSHPAVAAAEQLCRGADELSRERAAASRRCVVQITNYPSTPHLPFSPTVHSDDIQVRLCCWVRAGAHEGGRVYSSTAMGVGCLLYSIDLINSRWRRRAPFAWSVGTNAHHQSCVTFFFLTRVCLSPAHPRAVPSSSRCRR
jgi:hypothetical protein